MALVAQQTALIERVALYKAECQILTSFSVDRFHERAVSRAALAAHMRDDRRGRSHVL
jgi:hypothetical protein